MFIEIFVMLYHRYKNSIMKLNLKSFLHCSFVFDKIIRSSLHAFARILFHFELYYRVAFFYYRSTFDFLEDMINTSLLEKKAYMIQTLILIS